MTVRTLAYGPHPDQVGDLHLAGERDRPLVVLFHGGFWRMPYGRDELTAVIADLATRGHSVFNAEYRRVGVAGGGWPGTGEDAVAALEFASSLEVDRVRPAAAGIIVAGFSAGGHLALWAASELVRRGELCVHRVIGLAPVADLEAAAAAGLGNNAVQGFLGGDPSRYRDASPRARLPLGVPQVIIHGTADSAVPIALSRGYVAAAQEAGDDLELVEVPGGGHLDHLDPGSAAHRAFRAALARGQR